MSVVTAFVKVLQVKGVGPNLIQFATQKGGLANFEFNYEYRISANQYDVDSTADPGH